MGALIWAIPAALAILGLHRVSAEHARTLTIAAAAVLWIATIAAIAITVTRS